MAQDEQRHFGESLWQGWRLGWEAGPTHRNPAAPAMAQRSRMRPQFSGEGHLRKEPCHSGWSRGTGSNLGRGVLLQLLGLPAGGQPWVSWVAEQPAPKSFSGYPRGRLPLQVGVRPPSLSPLQSVSSFLGPPGSLLSRVEPPSFRRPPCGSNKMLLKRRCGVRQRWCLTERCGRPPRSPERLDLGQRNGSRRGGVGRRQSSSFLHVSPNDSPQHPRAGFCFCPMPLRPSIPPFLTVASTEGPGPQRAGEGARPASLHPEPLPGRHPLGSAPL